MRFLTLRSYFYSILIHLAVAALLVFSFTSVSVPVIKPAPRENIVEAVTVDNSEVEKELQKIKDAERRKEEQQKKKQQELERKLRDLEKKQKQAVNKRKQEEKRLANLKKKQQEEEKKRKEQEKRRLEEETKRKQEAEKKRKEELERKRREEEEKKRKEEELKKKQAEEALKKQLAEEQAAEQQRRDQGLLQKIISDIYRKVTGNFNKTGLPKGLECVLSVQTIPGGEIISVTLSQSSGNEIFDRRAITAVEKASPLPLPADTATFERLNLRRFNFRFKPED